MKTKTIITILIAGLTIGIGVYVVERRSNDDTVPSSQTSGGPQQNLEQLIRSLPDFHHFQAGSTPSSNSPSIDRLKKALGLFDAVELDAATEEFLTSTAPRGEKVAALTLLLSRIKAAEARTYLLELLTAMQPIEQTKALLLMYQGSDWEPATKARLLGAIRSSISFDSDQAIAPPEVIEAKTEIQRFFSGLVQQEADPSLRLQALSIYAAIVPQQEALPVVESVLSQGDFSPVERSSIRLTLMISEASNIQVEIARKVLADNGQTAAVSERVIATLAPAGAANALSQETKFVMQDYLKGREPAITPAADPREVSDYNSWLQAYSTAGSSSSTSPTTIATDFIRGLYDPFRLAAAVTLASQDVLNDLQRTFAIQRIAGTLESARVSATAGQQALIDAALSRIR